MNDKKLLVLVTEKCKASGLELDEAVNNITALMEQKGLDEKTAVIGWMAANSQTLKRVKMDIDAVILYYDVVGRTVQAKGKNVMAHDLIVLGAYKDAEGEVTKVLKGTLWLGDKENGLIDEVAKLQLNGQDRFTEREGSYFDRVQPYQHHSRTPSTGINVYSFALRPEEHQPSGTCNFSRIDKATLQLTVTLNTVYLSRTAQVRVYALNYNVLRVMSGMGGLAYSN